MKPYFSDARKLNQLIAIAANKAGFDTQDKDPNSQYRHDILQNLTGKTSTSKMTVTEKIRVLEYFKKNGFKITAAKSPKKNPPWLKKLISLWIEMHSDGFIRDPSFAALEQWAIKQVEHLNNAPVKLDWMKEESMHLIESLKNYQQRCEQLKKAKNPL